MSTPTVASTKAARHALVVSLLQRGTVHSQGELADLLAAEGVHVTQATLSRDLVELRAVKIRTATGALAYAVPGEGGESKCSREQTERGRLGDGHKRDGECLDFRNV